MKAYSLRCGMLMLYVFMASLVFGQQKQAKFPYASNGWTDEQAAIHLLSRFTYGFNARDTEDIKKEGLEKWFERQLMGNHKDKALDVLLEPYADAMLDNRTSSEKYLRAPYARRLMLDAGYISKDSVDNRSVYYKEKFAAYLRENGYKLEQELQRQFVASKVLRAAFSENQLREVMTDFWFNHFNVSFTKPQSSPFIPSYENHVIRPHALGRFEELLLSTAKSPAMLMYLDNSASTAVRPKSDKKSGINENYARELMELHTLGVDGGYTQKDVSEAARVLTGWTVFPMQGYSNKNIINTNTKANKDNIIDGDFVFVANRHDKGQKTVLGQVYEGDGYEEGVDLISFLSRQPQTAAFICRKLAIRFVNDEPDPLLVDAMVKTFLDSKGDIKAVLKTMVYAPAFWKKDNMREKVKTPFELAISSVRALDGHIDNPNKLINWVTKMGEKKYHYIAPTGFPDRSAYWINTGSLLNRMNFGLSFTGKNNSGVSLDLLGLANNREPESPEQALEVFARLLLPDMDIGALKVRLSPLLTAQNLQEKVASSSQKYTQAAVMEVDRSDRQKAKARKENNEMLAQVVGLIIGSPEFQRR